jgi:hypothetical protein
LAATPRCLDVSSIAEREGVFLEENQSPCAQDGFSQAELIFVAITMIKI